MSSFDRDRSIVTQVAAKIASDLVVAAEGNEHALDNLISQFSSTLDLVNESLTVAVFESVAVGGLKDAFGNDQVQVQPAPSNVVQFPQTGGQGVPATVSNFANIPQQPASVPAPIPGATDGDPETAALWIELFQDPSKFFDNRSNKKNPKGPDFTHKSKLQPGTTYKQGLWINDKKNPSWVQQNLAQLGA